MTTDMINEVHSEQELKQKEEKRYLDAIFWGGVILWAGLVFWAESADFLPQFAEAQPWSLIFIGAGAYGFVLSFIRLASPNFSNPAAGDYIWAAIFLLIGLGGLTSFSIAWPLIIVLVGIGILSRALFRRK